MNSSHVRIERLVIRLRGVSLQRARDVAAGLGPEMLQSLSQRLRTVQRAGEVHIDSIQAATVRSSGTQLPAELRGTIAQAIAESVETRLSQGRGSGVT